MAITLKSEDLAKVLHEIRQNPKDDNKKLEFINLIDPIIKVTTDKYPQDMAEDMAQEMKIFIMKRSDYIAEAYANDKIQNPTNYIFTVCKNTALNFLKKENKAKSNLVPLDDVKVEPIFTPKTAEKTQIIEEVRVQCLDYIKLRYTKRSDQKTAERLLVDLLQGKRPTWQNNKMRKVLNVRQENVKDIYSVVLLKLRELIEPRLEELSE